MLTDPNRNKRVGDVVVFHEWTLGFHIKMILRQGIQGKTNAILDVRSRVQREFSIPGILVRFSFIFLHLSWTALSHFYFVTGDLAVLEKYDMIIFHLENVWRQIKFPKIGEQGAAGSSTDFLDALFNSRLDEQQWYGSLIEKVLLVELWLEGFQGS